MVLSPINNNLGSNPFFLFRPCYILLVIDYRGIVSEKQCKVLTSDFGCFLGGYRNCYFYETLR